MKVSDNYIVKNGKWQNCESCSKWITSGKICGVCYMLRQAQGLDQ